MGVLLGAALALSPIMLCGGNGHAAEPGPAVSDGAPSQNGPIWGGRQHQPSLEEVIGREQAKGETPGISAETSQAAEELYQRVLKQSRQGRSPELDQRE